MRAGMLLVVLCATLLAGCATYQRCESRVGVSEVQGFGTGPTAADAQRAAWDDAIERLADMGIENYDTKIIESRNSKGSGPYMGMVVLRVTRQIDHRHHHDHDDDEDEDEDDD